MPKREFLMLAKSFDPKKHYIGGWFLSEKLDGMRCFWDGGISRGVPKADVPYANTSKDARYKEEQIATGLWSRYGNVIHAPDWWLDELPSFPLDGELYIPEFRQELMSIVKKIEPTPEWMRVKYYVFDTPSLETIFKSGSCGAQYWSLETIEKFLSKRPNLDYYPLPGTVFQDRIKVMEKRIEGKYLELLPQQQLSLNSEAARSQLDEHIDAITSRGGEGVILRSPQSFWVGERSSELLKVKPYDDAEGIVTGYITGKGKLLGLMGALILDYNGKRLELSGFTDEERKLTFFSPDNKDLTWASENPGVECPGWIQAYKFPLKSKVSFKYRGLTRDGVPQEARYWRKHVSIES